MALVKFNEKNPMGVPAGKSVDIGIKTASKYLDKGFVSSANKESEALIESYNERLKKIEDANKRRRK